jgi:hypothetical protein
MLNLPVKFYDLLMLVEQLSESERIALQAYLAQLPKKDNHRPKRLKPRVAGLGEGTITIADDFDDPLPDEFWLGKDA